MPGQQKDEGENKTSKGEEEEEVGGEEDRYREVGDNSPQPNHPAQLYKAGLTVSSTAGQQNTAEFPAGK